MCGPVQVCWEKFARYFDVELRQVPLLPDATGLRPEQLRDHFDENTIGVVAILGVTFTCDYEPVAELAEELDAIERDTGLDVPTFSLNFSRPGGEIVAQYGIGRDKIELLISDLQRSVERLDRSGPTTSADEQIGFHH